MRKLIRTTRFHDNLGDTRRELAAGLDVLRIGRPQRVRLYARFVLETSARFVTARKRHWAPALQAAVCQLERFGSSNLRTQRHWHPMRPNMSLGSAKIG